MIDEMKFRLNKRRDIYIRDACDNFGLGPPFAERKRAIKNNHNICGE